MARSILLTAGTWTASKQTRVSQAATWESPTTRSRLAAGAASVVIDDAEVVAGAEAAVLELAVRQLATSSPKWSTIRTNVTGVAKVTLVPPRPLPFSKVSTPAVALVSVAVATTARRSGHTAAMWVHTHV